LVTAGISSDCRMWRTWLMHIWIVTLDFAQPLFIWSIHSRAMVADSPSVLERSNSVSSQSCSYMNMPSLDLLAMRSSQKRWSFGTTTDEPSSMKV
jgi:hypothetical protein